MTCICFVVILVSFCMNLSYHTRFISFSVTKYRYASSVRPSLDDVERISKGQAARKRGVGSRKVPHRLNSEERIEWEIAKKRGYLTLRGTGWRKERGDSPLANIYRQLCDAKAVPCIAIARSIGRGHIFPTVKSLSLNDVDSSLSFDDFSTTVSNNSNILTSTDDVLVVDLSPLRTNDTEVITEIVSFCDDIVKKYPSMTNCENVSDFTKLGWTIQEVNFDENPIWRIPFYGYRASFSIRAEAKKAAEELAQKLVFRKSV